MRPIKFRAWNKRFKTMDFGGGDLLLRINSKDFLEPQQFTGLKDKNGKEIYFGDIVLDEDGYTGKIVEGEYGIIILWLVEDGTWIEAESPEEYFKPTRIEVIGNIYEHSHLLN